MREARWRSLGGRFLLDNHGSCLVEDSRIPSKVRLKKCRIWRCVWIYFWAIATFDCLDVSHGLLLPGRPCWLRASEQNRSCSQNVLNFCPVDGLPKQ